MNWMKEWSTYLCRHPSRIMLYAKSNKVFGMGLHGMCLKETLGVFTHTSSILPAHPLAFMNIQQNRQRWINSVEMEIASRMSSSSYLANLKSSSKALILKCVRNHKFSNLLHHAWKPTGWVEDHRCIKFLRTIHFLLLYLDGRLFSENTHAKKLRVRYVLSDQNKKLYQCTMQTLKCFHQRVGTTFMDTAGVVQTQFFNKYK